MADDDIAANIGDNGPYYPGGKAIGPGKPTYNESVKIRDTGASTPPGHNAPMAPFVNPDPKSKHSF